jgi:hypothetical protein
MQAKCRSIDELVRADEPLPIDRMREELEWLIDAADELDSWESRRASVQASRLLEIFDSHVSRTELPYPGNPDDVAPLYGVWPAYETEDVDSWWELDVVEGSVWFTYGARDALRRQVFGEAPWPRSPGLPEPGTYHAMLNAQDGPIAIYEADDRS